MNATEIRTLSITNPREARRAICANMEAAILSATGAGVEVCMMAQADRWCVSGQKADVLRAHAVLSRANMVLLNIEDDAELGETFATYTSKV